MLDQHIYPTVLVSNDPEQSTQLICGVFALFILMKPELATRAVLNSSFIISYLPVVI